MQKLQPLFPEEENTLISSALYPQCKLVEDDGISTTDRMILSSSFSDKASQQKQKDLRSVGETTIGYSHTFGVSVHRCKLNLQMQGIYIFFYPTFLTLYSYGSS